MFSARSVAAKHSAVLDILDGEADLTCAGQVDVLWGDRKVVGYLLDMLKNDHVSEGLAEDIISSLFRISDDDRPDSIRVLSLA